MKIMLHNSTHRPTSFEYKRPEQKIFAWNILCQFEYSIVVRLARVLNEIVHFFGKVVYIFVGF